MKTELYIAVEEEQIETVSNLISNGANVNLRCRLRYSDGDAPLHIAIKMKNLIISKLLIDAGADLSSKDYNRKTPLLLASEVQAEDIVKLLIDAHVDVNEYYQNNKYTSLHLAIKSKNANIVKLLIEAGSNVNLPMLDDTNWPSVPEKHYGSSAEEEHEVNENLWYPLQMAIECESIDIVELLVKAKANLKLVYGCEKDTSLHHVIKLNKINIFEVLLKAGSDVNLKNKDGDTPLHLAFKSRNINFVEALLKAGADVNLKNNDGDTPLHLAFKSRNINFVEALLKAGSDVNLTNHDEDTPLHLAIKSRELNIVEVLLKAGSNVNIISDYNDSPIKLALDVVKDLTISQILLEYGADLRRMNEIDEYDYYCPLVAVLKSRNKKLFKTFIDLMIDPNAKDLNGDTALHHTAKWGNSENVRLLLEAGADVNIKNEEGYTPLHKGVYSDNKNVLKLLVSAGADLMAKNEDENTPIHIAAKEKYLNSLRFLIYAGADTNQLSECNLTSFSLFTEGLSWTVRSQDFQLVNEILRLLVDCIDINLTCSKGKNVVANLLKWNYFSSDEKLYYKIVVQHIAKCKALDQLVDQQIINKILDEKSLKEHFTKCTDELKKAKSTKLQDCWVTFFNLLVDSESKLVKYAGNENLVQDFKKNVVNFPIYGSSMQENMSKGIYGRKLFDNSANILSNHLPIFNPTHLIISDILEIFCREDFEKLLE